ncbi:hypothetical protein PNEG_01233 [Pneumocystis murina B123]|uniref:Protein yippee-like n=1 Tax=Pneumocystis murina (strain B123) TaxID=1069680 RepID=M7NP86_PNEMU|nr:hypothetical protein PNEG_01233 [Pneumocystis murina B123]EMR10523.1 hypothetical protein PNEG_01233 [Pneumocystis murina B123]
MGLSYNVYLTGSKIYSCSKCKTHLSDHKEIASKVRNSLLNAFRGQHGRAYLFNTVVNIIESPMSEDRTMTTGRHIVRDISCKQCGSVVGWKYDKAFESSQMYKEGKYILEIELLTMKT